MKILSNIKKSTRRVLLASVVTAAVLGLGAFKMASAENVSFSSARDCDSNAVVYCGAMSVNQLITRYDSSSQATSIHHIYSYFGITSTEVHNMAKANTSSFSVYAGKVNKNGNVYVNGNLVATNALTAGREYISGSTKVTYNGTTFYTRTPSVSFLSDSLDAFVVKESGKFSFAVIASCGNPVKATPTPQPTPNYTISKEVRVKGDDTWHKGVTVKAKTHVVYRIVVKSTGNAAVKNLNVHDNLPKHVQLVSNTLTRDGTNVTQTNEQNFFNGTGITLSSLPAGDQVVFRFEAIVGPNDTATKCVQDTFTNTGVMTATSLPKKNDTANVTEKCTPPAPAYSCDQLNAVFNSRTTYTFNTRATANNGAVITKYVYNFGDNTTKTVRTNSHTNTVSHTYAGNLQTDKHYTTTVTVYVSVNGAAAKPVTSSACRATVTVKAQPLAECTELRFTQNGRTVSVQAIVAPTNAVINAVTYDFGDSFTTMRNDLNTVSHTYANDVDQATISAQVTFRSPEGVPTSTCQAQVSFTSTPGTPGTPTSLVNTGPGSIAGLFAAVSIIGAFAHRIFIARRLN